MPTTEIRVFRDPDETVPVKEWLDNLETTKPKAYKKCLARILELEEHGNAMRRPHADTLRDGIHELRATLSNIQYRVLYFFFDKHAVALSHGITKKSKVPPAEIEAAIEHMNLVKQSPEKYTVDFEL